MKKIICLISILLFVNLYATDKNEFQQIIQFPSMSKKIIFDKSLKWLASTFKSAKAVIEYSDIQSGTIMGNIILSASASSLKSKLTIDIKDNKSRLTYVPISCITLSGRELPLGFCISGDMKKTAQHIFDEYEVYLKDTTKDNKDW